MITLHKLKKDSYSNSLEERLDNLVVSYRSVEHRQKKGGRKLPYIEENGKIFQQDKDIEEWFNELESELNWQRSLSGDGCYINPKDGNVC